MTKDIDELESELQGAKICMQDAYDCMEVVNDLLNLCLNHPEAHEHRQWRKGLYQALERVSKTLQQGIEEEDYND